MRVSSKSALPLAALLFMLLLAPQAALAKTADCPKEPTSVPTASGDVFAGVNCTLNTPGDVDQFVFTANEGDTWQPVVGINTGSQNICLSLYDPNLKQIFSGCTNIAFGVYDVVADQKLVLTGSYYIDITELTEGAVNYGTSLERLYPFPPDAQAIVLNQRVDGVITPLTDQNLFTFAGVTTGKYRVSATVTNNPTENLCVTAYYTNGATAGSGCTNIAFSVDTVDVDFTPTQAGKNMVLLNEAGNAGTVDYTMEVSCLVGDCNVPPPSCTLTDAATYDASSSTLTMNFTVGNTYPTTWNAWLTYQKTMTHLFSIAQPITVPPKKITKTKTGLPKEGKVGVLSTLTTPAKGIACSSWVQVNTGTP
jgi:hypothetical protein